MAIRAHLNSAKLLLQIQPRLTAFRPKPCFIRCSSSANSPSSDADLSLQFATQVVKLKLKNKQKEQAFLESKRILYTELCKYLGFPEEELKQRWKLMQEIDKWVVVEGFVSEWSEDFHPLLAKSVKQMVEEHLEFESSAFEAEQSKQSSNSSPSGIVMGLKKMIGFD